MGSTHYGSICYLDGNTFIQAPERNFALVANINSKYALSIESEITRIGGKNNQAYFCPEDYGIAR